MRHCSMYLLLLCFIGNLGNAERVHKLKVMSLLGFTGSEPLDFRQCQLAQQFVVDTVNGNGSILRDYRIEFEFRDEGLSGMKIVSEAVRFFREANGSLIAPVAVGSVFSLGCKAWGATAGHMNAVMIAASCTAPSQTAKRGLYPNMYRIRSPSQLLLYSRLYLIKMIAGWQRIGIISYSNTNSFNLEMGNLFYDISARSGIDVVKYEASSDFNDELMESLKRADIRVFVIEAAEIIAPLFLCRAYVTAITGSKYLFIFNVLAYVDPNLISQTLIPRDCTKAMISEQLQRAIFLGSPFQVLFPPSAKSELGHSLEEFDRLFLKLTNNTMKPDYYFRHNCYDVALQSLIVLNDTERRLNAMNLSLRDYATMPQLVMQVTNESAAKVKFNNLRHGEFKYSPRLEWDYEPQLVVAWSPRKGLHVRYQIKFSGNSSDFLDMSAYSTVKIEGFPDNYLPKDGPSREAIVIGVPRWVFGSYIFVAISLSVAEISFLLKKLKLTTVLKDKLIFILSLLFLNAASVIFVVPSMYRNAYTCQAGVVMVIVGLSMLHSWLVLQFRAKVRVMQAMKSSTIRSESTNLGTLIFVSTNLAVAIAWLVVDSFEVLPITKVTMDLERDVVVTETGILSYSSRAQIWLAALAGGNALVLLVGVLLAIRVKSDPRLNRYPDLKPLMTAIIASVTLFSASVALGFLAVNQVMLDIEIATALFLHSAVNFVALFYREIFTNLAQGPSATSAQTYSTRGVKSPRLASGRVKNVM